MKTNIYILSLIAILAGGCAKKTETTPEKPKYDVTFSVSGFESATDKISPSIKQQSLSATTNPHDLVGNVKLFIYNAQGDLVADIKEECCGTADGIVIEGLEIGNYTAVALGDWYSAEMDISHISNARIENSPNDIYNGEVYLDKIEFEVSTVQSNHVTMVLQRMVGLLNIEITDSKPSDVSHVRATLHSMANEYFFNDFMPLNSNFNPVFDNADPYYGFGGYFFVPFNDSAYKTSVLLEVIGWNGSVLKSKRVNDVTVGTNIRTTLRGKLYEPNAQGFSIELDTEWSGEKNIDF